VEPVVFLLVYIAKISSITLKEVEPVVESIKMVHSHFHPPCHCFFQQKQG